MRTLHVFIMEHLFQCLILTGDKLTDVLLACVRSLVEQRKGLVYFLCLLSILFFILLILILILVSGGIGFSPFPPVFSKRRPTTA